VSLIDIKPQHALLH